MRTSDCGREIAISNPKGDVYKANQYGYLDERADNGGESCSAFYSEARDGDGDGELKIVGSGREGEGRRLRVICAALLRNEERSKEHHYEIREERHADPENVPRERDEGCPLEGEHHNDRKKQKNERDGPDLRRVDLVEPLATFGAKKQHPREEAGGKGDAEVEGDRLGDIPYTDATGARDCSAGCSDTTPPTQTAQTYTISGTAAGTLKAVHVENSQPVEFDQPLIVIE